MYLLTSLCTQSLQRPRVRDCSWLCAPLHACMQVSVTPTACKQQAIEHLRQCHAHVLSPLRRQRSTRTSCSLTALCDRPGR